MQFAFGVFLKPITEDLGSDRGVISSAILVAFCSSGIAVLVVGRLIDRFGIRTVLLPAIALFALGTALLGVLTTSPVVFIALYGLLGIVAAGVTPLPYAKAVAGAFDHRRGLALGVSMAGVGLGAALLPQLAQALIARYGWRDAYIGLGIFVFVVSFPSVALWVREPKSAGADHRALPGFTAREALKTSSFWLLAISFFLVALAAGGVIAHVVPILTDRGVEPQAATRAIGAAGLALIVGRLLAGHLLDRIFAPYVAGCFFLTLLLGIVMLLSSSSAPLSIVATILVGVGLGAEIDLIAFLISRYLGMRSFGETYGYMFAMFMFASGLGPFLMGLTFQKAGSYTPGLIALGVGVAIATALMTRLGPYAFAERAEDLAPAPTRQFRHNTLRSS